MSHSQVVEWISGSFIQSHWPWETLWPISMFSTLFANASDAVPTTQPARDRLQPITSRAATSRVRWNLMVRRM